MSDSQTPVAQMAQEIVAMRTMAALRGWPSGQVQMLSVILDPHNHDGALSATTPATLMAEFDEDWDGYSGSNFIHHVDTVSAMLAHHFRSHPIGGADYGLTFECSSDGVISGAAVTAAIGPWPETVVLTESLSWHEMTTDQSATGTRHAASIAEALHDVFAGLVTKARKHGLIAD